MKQARLITTTREKRFVKKTLKAVAKTNYHILKTDGAPRQQIDGFGCCFNELGYLALQKADSKQREKLLHQVFSPEEGNFNYCRMPIGANDYAVDWYSLDEVDGDYDLKHFSIDRDQKYLIPFIKEAQKLQPDMTLFASPWSPPTWMKNPKVYNYGKLVWEEKNLTAYANYFKKFVEAYDEEEIAIHQVHVQNEPIADQKFPSCCWTGEEMRDFIKDYLGPIMKQSHPEVEVWLGTVNAPYDNYGHQPNWYPTNYNRFGATVLSDADALAYISGVGYQWGGKHAIQQTHIAYPGMKLAQTENECGDGKNTWDYAEYVFGLMWHYFQNGVSAYTYWNIALEQGGISTWGWQQNSMVTVEQDGTICYQPEYYLMQHFSRFVKRGAHLVSLQGDFAANALGFINPDQSLVAVIQNPFDEERNMTVQYDGENYSFTMPPRSFQTVVVDAK